MRPSHRFVAASTIIAFTSLIGGCASSGGRHALPPATIAFDNQSPDPVRVYLVVENGGEYPLGRVYPMQDEFLRLPRHLDLATSGRVAIVAVPLGEGSSFHRLARGPHTREVVSTMAELSAQRFVITPLALHAVHGPWSRVP